MTKEDVEKLAIENGGHNNEVIAKFFEDVQGKKVGALSKKNVFDKGAKFKLGKETEVVDMEGYNFKLANDRTEPPKQIQILK